jgi:hypothetical protein
MRIDVCVDVCWTKGWRMLTDATGSRIALLYLRGHGECIVFSGLLSVLTAPPKGERWDGESDGLCGWIYTEG